MEMNLRFTTLSVESEVRPYEEHSKERNHYQKYRHLYFIYDYYICKSRSEVSRRNINSVYKVNS